MTTRRLRPYQTTLHDAVVAGWQEPEPQKILSVAPTGSGKTVIMGAVMRTINGTPACAIAHRAELVAQLSTALARERIPHRIIGPPSLRRQCSAVHMKKIGQNWVQPDAPMGVASVRTLINESGSWINSVQRWFGDEGHHYLPGNEWGKAVALFTHPSARGGAWTATPRRADRKALSTMFTRMVEGPTPRDLIDDGYLTPYRIFAPPSDINYNEVAIGSTGDYSLPQLRATVHKSTQFVGDIVTQWKRIALGKLTVVFCVDIDNAREVAAEYRKGGIRAEVLTGETDPLLRVQMLEQFERRDITVLVTVDIVSEGFDLPAIECVVMARKTESLSLFLQQFGRALRVMVAPELEAIWDQLTAEQRRGFIEISSKPSAIVIDHVQNVHRHGLPDSPREWSLEGFSGGSNNAGDGIPTRTCVNPREPLCLRVYERFLPKCPYCGFVPLPVIRQTPAAVEGDLYELPPEVLAALRGDADRIMSAPPIGTPQVAMRAWQERIIAQHVLREAIALWSGWHLALGKNEQYQYRKFFHDFGIDVASAQALGRPQAEALAGRIQSVLSTHGVTQA